jgi:hypothetical protein
MGWDGWEGEGAAGMEGESAWREEERSEWREGGERGPGAKPDMLGRGA